MRRKLLYCISVISLLLLTLGLVGCNDAQQWETVEGGTVQSPWEAEDKNPEDYTWEEFQAMDGADQIRFQNAFDSPEAFESWMLKAEEHQASVPWEKGEKAPIDYTWEEFLALSGDLQIQFQNSFESDDAFEAWMLEAQNAE